MNNEEKILQLLTELSERLERVEDRTEILPELSQRLGRVESRAAESANMLTEMNGRLGRVEDRIEILPELSERLGRVENRAAESLDMLKAVLHNQEVARAEISGLKATTASADGLRRVDAKLNALNERLFVQETNLQELKLVK